jgi:hypothetical protein
MLPGARAHSQDQILQQLIDRSRHASDLIQADPYQFQATVVLTLGTGKEPEKKISMRTFEIPLALLSLKGVWAILSPLLGDAAKDVFKDRVKELLKKPSSLDQARQALFGLLKELEEFRKSLERFVDWLNAKAQPGASEPQVTSQIENLAEGVKTVFLALNPEEGARHLHQSRCYAEECKFATMLEDFDTGMAGIGRKIETLGTRLVVYNPDLLDTDGKIVGQVQRIS